MSYFQALAYQKKKKNAKHQSNVKKDYNGSKPRFDIPKPTYVRGNGKCL